MSCIRFASLVSLVFIGGTAIGAVTDGVTSVSCLKKEEEGFSGAGGMAVGFGRIVGTGMVWVAGEWQGRFCE